MPDRSTRVVAGHYPAEGWSVQGTGAGGAPHLVAGMNGDLGAWEVGLALACGVELGDAERQRLDVVGGPPPVALEKVLRGLGTDRRPPGHLRRLRLLADGYRLALDGDREVLRWVEAVLGHPDRSLGRADLLGPDGFPVDLRDLGAGLEAGPLPDGWLGRVDLTALAAVSFLPEEPAPVWVQLREVGQQPQDAGGR